jgi:hypothetical protein
VSRGGIAGRGETALSGARGVVDEKIGVVGGMFLVQFAV